MKEKLTLQDLVDLLAKKTSLTKKEADAFFREFFAVIIEDVFNNEPVKIKDFGTFKLTKVNSRESVDVNTGEKIEIPAHYKLSFIADKSLKNLVNKPFAQFETTLLEDGVSFDAIEILDNEEDTIEEDTATDEIDIPVKRIEPSIIDTPEEEHESTEEVAAQPEDETEEVPEITESKKEVVPEIEEPAQIEEPVFEETIQEDEEPVKQEESPIREETIQEEEPVQQEEPPIGEEPTKEEKQEKEEEAKPAEAIVKQHVSPYSFVYTYTNQPATKSDSITIVVPKENIISKKEVEAEPEKIEEKQPETTEAEVEPEKAFETNEIIEEITENTSEEIQNEEPETDGEPVSEDTEIHEDTPEKEDDEEEIIPAPSYQEPEKAEPYRDYILPVSPDDDDIPPFDAEEDELEDIIPLDQNKIKEKIDQLKEAIDALSEVELEQEFLLDEEPEPEIVEETPSSEEKVRSFLLEKEKEKEKTDLRSDISQSDDDTAETIRREAEAKDNGLLNKLEPIVDLQEIENLPPVGNANNSPEEEDDFIYDFYQETAWTRVRRRLPLIIFLLAIITFGAYNFVKLFNSQRQMYVPNKRTLTESDTLPYIHEGIVPFKDGETPAEIAAAAEDSDEVTPAAVDGNTLTATANKPSSGFEKVISDRLKIKTLRKATSQLSKHYSTSGKANMFETVESGASLRSISTKYYGSNIFWGYIYLENRDIIRDIDNISIGTILKIPDLRKYNTSVDAPDAVEKAKEVEAQVYRLAYRGE